MLRLKLVGHYRYHGISGNTQALRKFARETSKLAYKWINRRSQKKSFTFAQYCKFKKYNPLPEPKIYHLTYTLSSYFCPRIEEALPKNRVEEISKHGSVRGIK